MSRPRGVTFLGYLYYAAGIIGIISGIDGVFDISYFLFPSLNDIIGPQEFGHPGVMTAEKLILNIQLIAELILGPFYLVIGHGLLRLNQRAIEMKLVIAIIGIALSVVTEIVLVSLHPDDLFQAILSVDIELEPRNFVIEFGGTISVGIGIVIDVIIISYLHKPSIKRYFESHSPPSSNAL
jgi:hypothetical protein